jgi:hypothetical protein
MPCEQILIGRFLRVAGFLGIFVCIRLTARKFERQRNERQQISRTLADTHPSFHNWVYLLARSFSLPAVLLGVDFRSFGGVVRGVMKVAVSDVRVMCRGLVVAFFMMFCGLAMMVRRVVVMFRSFLMMLNSLLCHLPS